MATDATIDYKTEQAVLGAIINDPTGSKAVIESLEVTDFGDRRHQAIFSTIKRLYLTYLEKGGKDIFSFDNAVLLAELKADRIDEEAGGLEYIYDLSMTAVGNDQINKHVGILKNLSLVRNLFEKVDSLKRNFTQSSTDYSEFLGIFEDSVKEITMRREVTDFIDMKKAIINMQQYYSRPNLSFSSGYPSLDNLLNGGFQPGSLIILAARPSVGKTALALNLVLNVASVNRSTAIFSLEMSSEQLIMRMLENTSRLSEQSIRKYLGNKLNENSAEGAEISSSFKAGLDKLEKKSIFFDDHSSSTIGEILSKARRLKASYSNLSLIAIDYIGLISVPSNKSKEANRQQEVAMISRNLKAMARDLQVPVIALCQLSREVDSRKDHKPVLSDLRDSGAIEQDADQVITLYRSDYYDNDDKKEDNNSAYPDAPEDIPAPVDEANDSFSEVHVDVQKNRNGKTGEVILTFNKLFCRFDDTNFGYDNDDGYYGG